MKQKNKLLKLLLLIVAMSSFTITLPAQQSKYGNNLPTEGNVRILIVFAEIVTTAPCNTTDYDPSDWSWPTGSAAPPNADNYLDAVVQANPLTKLTRYYKDMSLGELYVFGDYFDRTVQVPCALFGSMGNESAIYQLNYELVQNGITTTKHGYPINVFDNYQNGTAGYQRLPGNPDGNIDATVILWRNHPSYYCQGGLGVGNFINESVLGKTVSIFGAWDGCPSSWLTGYDDFFVAEFFHALMGGNNFHTGSGASSGTFMYSETGSYSISAQSGSESNVVCGWDRNYLDWKGTRTYPVSALDATGTSETVSDISIVSNPGTALFVLRDFVTVGDAVRIKLPHFNWQANGDKKTQYLWIENHQTVNEYDHNKGYYSGCGSWAPGLYLQIQAGKDLISGSEVYGGSTSSRNGLNDWLFPFPADGRWDFYYDDCSKNQNWANCAWGNYSLPYSTDYPFGNANFPNKPNPFTGNIDLWGDWDSETPPDGVVNDAGDLWNPTIQKWVQVTPVACNPPAPTLPRWGDQYDAFNVLNQKISLQSNPAPVPVYTIIEGGTIPQTYDNRSIHLNNLSIQILSTNFFNVGGSQPKSFLISIKWDDKAINNDVRWCGNIVLRNDPLDPAMRTMQIDLAPNKKIVVDEGISPTKLHGTFSNNNWHYADPSYLHLLSGTITTLQSGSQLQIKNASTLHVQSGATLIIGPNAKVDVDATSIICIEDGANIVFQNPVTSRIYINGKPYNGSYNIVNSVLQTLPNYYYSLNSITTSGTAPGVSMPVNGNVLLQARTTISLLPNTTITPNAGQTFTATIFNPYDCSNVNNYDLRTSTESDPVAELPAVNNKTGILAPDRISLSEKINIYPNPANDRLQIEMVEVIAYTTLKLYSTEGKIVKETKLTDLKTTLDVTDLPSGLYFVNIQSGDSSENRKIQIIR